METSTPINSPKKKKHSLIQKFIPINESLGDIKTEIQTRRQEAINKSTEYQRRLSAAPLLAGYTASQLTQHCKDVIKLSTENKINCKNAFNFWLIDVMAAMAKKRDSEINQNFQVASCTLDASVKIYGYRVDAIHTDAVKMAGGFFSKETATGDREEEEVENREEGEEVTAKVKIKKKRRKLTVVPPESLNAKSECEMLLDVIPQQNFLMRKTDGNDLLIKIPKYNDGGLLLLECDYPCWPYDENITLVPKYENKEIFDHSGLLALLSDIEVTRDEELCSAYSNFEFGKASEEQSDSETELQTSQNSGNFEFDLNSSVRDIEMDVDKLPEGQRNRIHIPAGGFDSDEDVVVPQEKQSFSQNLAISYMKARLSVNPSDYSMFDEKVFKAWAGPSHWKVKPIRKPLEEYTNNEEISKPVASKRTRKGKIKTPAGLFDISEEFLVKSMAECEKTTLFKSTMLNWNPQNTTMPDDLRCKTKNLFSLYHIPSFSILLQSTGKESELGEISDHNEEREEDEEGEHEDEEELEYCSSSVVLEKNDVHDTEKEPHVEDEVWDVGNMVKAPSRVEKIPVSAFKRRKHVDIKHLKKGLWRVLTDGKTEGSDENTTEVNSIHFEELIKIFPSKVPQGFSSLLSTPLIFNALLHLTNEKCLVLTQDKTKSLNFVISH